MRIRFVGAARSVTGSLHVLEVGERRIALDCGLVQGHRAEARKLNAELRVDAASLDAVILSHAHVDHSGALPMLVKNGFRGKIHATPATADLAGILLRDSAHIQLLDARYMTEHAKRHAKNAPAGGFPVPVEPIYDDADVLATVERFAPQPYHRSFEVVPGVRATFLEAGHLLGSAVTLLEVEEREGLLRLAYTGDLGRPGHPIIRDPERPAGPIDYLLCESTYGDRVHDAYPDLERKLGEALSRAFARKGRVVIPAFSVGRTQNLVYHLNRLMSRGDLATVPVFVDSPLAVDATEIYRRHPECYDEEMRRFIDGRNGDDPFGFKLLTYIRSPEESKALNEREGPFVIISASGMCEHGRILHHLKNNVSRPETTIVFIGFQPRDTLGRRLVEREKSVKIFGETYKLRAEIVKLNGFSAHADRDELTSYIEGIAGLRGVFLVHGEERASLALAEHLRARGVPSVDVPAAGESRELSRR